ncbi:MAG: isocitrate lyase/PEP mutase family protein [Rhodospirillales bacterium]|nr:isocitrate lyase/PEP mutase family protein [Rhodospirillales bacterium]MDE0381636.1 isocitrate lyase/PEP mutase family protein [Rhodospirillales bacterium]
MNASEKRAALAGAVRQRQFVVAPGVYDMISAKVADGLGFRALYMTGYGVAASHLGLPDAGIASYADVVGRVRTIAGGTASPLICDADTGFGGLLNVRHTVQGYEDAGCSAIQLEDQEMPKKCGHTPGRRVVPLEDMLEKIRVAAEARSDPDFLIIARTDARTSLGLDEALARGRAFADAGADVIFIEAPENEDEIARIGETIEKPLLANMVDSGKTPIVPAERLAALGFSIAIYPAIGMLPAAGSMKRAFEALKRDGSTANVDAPMISLPEMHTLMGFEDVWSFERRWARPDAEAAE